MLADILEDEGHEVVTASHGQGALEKIRARKPALVITDFMMPVMTGLELAQAIRGDQELADLPIILVSGAQGAIGRQHGDLFVEVLDKPYKNETLLAMVERILAA
jgi:CheY-like chemotaxis protein